jgi:hypothetical protein
MKKIIFTAIAFLFLSLTGYAQITTLDKFFNHYSEQDQFTYIFYGGSKELNKTQRIPESFQGEAKSLNFVKSLSSLELKGEALKEFVTSLKEVLTAEKFEIVKSIKNGHNRTETYLKRIENEEISEVLLIASNTNLYVRWTSGKLK